VGYWIRNVSESWAAVIVINEKETVMRFEHDYSAQQLNFGVGMVCHPCSLGEISCPKYDILELKFNRLSQKFYQVIPKGGWDTDPWIRELPRISEGKSVEPGDPFPSHWHWNPYTGGKLPRLHRDYSDTHLSMGDGMIFHPVTGSKLDECEFTETITTYQGMSASPRYYKPAIGDGRDRKAGEPYPDHWRFDPYTGAPLS
jgi:hypothetical protein